MRVSLRVVPGISKAGVEPAEKRTRTGSGRGINRLTDKECHALKPAAKQYKRSDGLGMYLLIKPSGSRLWQWPYVHQGKPNVFSIGAFPEVSLAHARLARDQARAWLKAGLDPNIKKKAERNVVASRQGDTFAKLTEEWLAKQSVEWSKDHAAARRRLIEQDLLKALGAMPLAELAGSPAAALAALQRIEARGAYEVASKARIVGSMVCRYGIVAGRMTSDPFAHLGEALTRPPVKHRATVPLVEMPALFEAIAAVPAEMVTKLAFYWLVLTAARTDEMRFATWGEIHGERWRIPPERMKTRLEHVVPLTSQALQVLELAGQLRTSKDGSALLFPGFTRHGALSENALLALLARAGYYGRQTSHGFRASFSTWAHEDFEAPPDVIEACLAHVKDGIRGIYNRSSYLSQRRTLLQAWADQCVVWGMQVATFG